MRFTQPIPNTIFTITAAQAWPVIVCETDVQGPHIWEWVITWDTFTVSGRASTAANIWNAAQAIVNRGGTLTVKASAGAESSTITVEIQGTSQADVIQFLNTRPESAGFERIIQHEATFKHFNANNVPIKSFDRGYGMCQLTHPTPTFEQVWNWKQNVDGGLSLFAQKRIAATNYLSQSGRTFTETQLKYETVCRWNGGQYHRWDGDASRWIRAPHILCNTKTGNIGWEHDRSTEYG